MTPLSVPLNVYTSSLLPLTSSPPDSAPPSSLPVSNPTDSFWLNPDENPLLKEGSQGDLGSDEVDICIIGSGITGISALWYLLKGLHELKEKGIEHKEKVKVMVLEARDFCSGATGRNGGHLLPNPFVGFKARQESHGTSETVKTFDFEWRCAGNIIDFIQASGIESDIDFVQGGHMMLLFTEEEEKVVKVDYDAAAKAGMKLEDLGVEWVEEAIVERQYGAPYPGIKSRAWNLWPSKLITALFKASRKIADESGFIDLYLHTSTPVTSITTRTSGSRNTTTHTLHTPRGLINSNYIIHATNAYTGYLLPHLYGGPGGIIPTRGQVIAIRHALGNGTEKGPEGELRKMSWDGNEGFEYWFPRPSHKPIPTDTTPPGTPPPFPLIILGGGREIAQPGYETYVSDDSTTNTDVGEGLRKFLGGVFPGSGEGVVEKEWSGIMGYTRTGEPFVGPVMSSSDDSGSGVVIPGQYVAAGYTGHGMPRAFACGEIVASMILADLRGKDWEKPDWVPESYLTWNK
ncbi:FAD dependent oxidoreductase [Marasmius fiardii PR-910]|nr:FAD dependent oxidoreductase [Marasmius fiardii PR-910]